MAYLLIEDFKSGMDVRKSAFTAPPGSLRRITNGHLTRGGEVEKRKAMSLFASLPNGQTKGLHAVGASLYVFGTAAGVTVPAGFTYQQLVLSAPGPSLVRILSATNFRGKPYVLAEFSNGERHHFYNGAQVSDFDAGFGTLQANEDVAAALAALIDSHAAVTATASGTVVTVTAVALNTAFTITGQVVNGGADNTQSLVVATPTPASSGVAQVSTVTIGGTYEDADTFTVTVDGTVYTVTGAGASKPTHVKTFRDKVYAVAGSVFGGSGYRGSPPVPDPTAWSPTYAGAFAINLVLQDEGAEELVAIGVYQNRLAVFSRKGVQVWDVDPDPDKNFLAQVLPGIGALAPNSVVSLGSIDLFFLSDTGIRSVRARDSSNLASTQDVGTAVDPDVIDWIRSVGTDIASRASAVVDPVDGRVLMAIGGRVYVFSHFPGSKIAAWSTYEFDFTPEVFAILGTRVYCRAGDDVYLYGGATGNEYDSSPVLAKLPFHDCGTPATKKSLRGVDLGCEGAWEVSVALNPDDPDTEEVIARTSGSTYGTQQRFDAAGQSTHFSLILRNESPGYARLANAVIHYDAQEAG